MKKIYIASDMFSDARKGIINNIANSLRDRGMEVYVPHEHDIPNSRKMNNKDWASKVFFEDVSAIDACDEVVYICEGMVGDIGSAWECGYAYAKGKNIVVHEMAFDGSDWMLSDMSGKISLMVAQSASTEIFSYQS